MGRAKPTYDTYPDPVYRVVDFVGEFFLGGLALGSAFHFVRGLRGLPGPSGARLAGAVDAVRANAPRVAGKFGAYCAFFSAVDNAATLARGSEDTWNSAAAGAATWGLHGMRRRGARAAARCGILGATGILGIDLALTALDRLSYSAQNQIDRGQEAALVVHRPKSDGRWSPPWWLRMSPRTEYKGRCGCFPYRFCFCETILHFYRFD